MFRIWIQADVADPDPCCFLIVATNMDPAGPQIHQIPAFLEVQFSCYPHLSFVPRPWDVPKCLNALRVGWRNLNLDPDPPNLTEYTDPDPPNLTEYKDLVTNPCWIYGAGSTQPYWISGSTKPYWIYGSGSTKPYWIYGSNSTRIRNAAVPRCFWL